jgi:hypothetical protein
VLYEQSEVCPHCGIVFEKYRKYHLEQTVSQDVQSPIVTLDKEVEATPLIEFLFHITQQNTMTYMVGRLIIFVGLVILDLQLMSASIESNAAGNSFLHLVNLPFHETGQAPCA